MITTQIFLPGDMTPGMDLVHSGIIMMVNQGIGLLAPPVGFVLFLGSALGEVLFEKKIGAIWPFYLCLIAVLMLITLIPPLTLRLPGMFRCLMLNRRAQAPPQQVGQMAATHLQPGWP